MPVHIRILPASPRRMAQTPNCIVKLEATRMAVSAPASGRSSSCAPSGGPHTPGAVARALK